MPEPVIPLELLRQAIEDKRLVFHIEPIVALPQRKPFGYDLVPRILLEDGEFADRPDFMPRRGGEESIARLELDGLEEAVVIARRSRTAGTPITLFVPLSRATLGSAKAVETDPRRARCQPRHRRLAAVCHRAERIQGTDGQANALRSLPSARWASACRSPPPVRCASITPSCRGSASSRVRVDATRFLRQPESFTDFHAADIAAYGRRFGIELLATGIIDEQQLLSLFEDGHHAGAGPPYRQARPGPPRPAARPARIRSRRHLIGPI